MYQKVIYLQFSYIIHYRPIDFPYLIFSWDKSSTIKDEDKKVQEKRSVKYTVTIKENKRSIKYTAVKEKMQ